MATNGTQMRRDAALRALISDRMQPGVAPRRRFRMGAAVITTRTHWATNCPEYKVTAVEVTRVSQPSEWQKHFEEFNRQQQGLLDHAIVDK
jgi:formate dehydrogenase major subunit